MSFVEGTLLHLPIVFSNFQIFKIFFLFFSCWNSSLTKQSDISTYFKFYHNSGGARFCWTMGLHKNFQLGIFQTFLSYSNYVSETNSKSHQYLLELGINTLMSKPGVVLFFSPYNFCHYLDHMDSKARRTWSRLNLWKSSACNSIYAS